MPPPNATLIETCLESGSMTQEQIETALKGTRHWPATRAIVSLIEAYLADAAVEAEARGQDPRIRDECCGARRWLKELRHELNELATEPPADAEEEEDKR